MSISGTCEDPVEFNLPGINQVQMHEEIGLTFASSLRSFLRQDPDIIMVGEIRDFETAEIAVKAALTGHMVLSTLHTNDAPQTINRLLNMGVEPFLVASSVNLILAQRLARKVCLQCKTEIDPPVEALRDLGVKMEEIGTFPVYEGKGCHVCSNTGFKGRVALYEVMPMTDDATGACPCRSVRHANKKGSCPSWNGDSANGRCQQVKGRCYHRQRGGQNHHVGLGNYRVA